MFDKQRLLGGLKEKRREVYIVFKLCNLITYLSRRKCVDGGETYYRQCVSVLRCVHAIKMGKIKGKLYV